MVGTSFFYWLHETAASCYFGVDLGNGLDYYSLSRLAEGTPYSSSDLLYVTLLLPFHLVRLFQVQLPFSLLLFWTKFSMSISSSPVSADKDNLSPTSILQKCSKTIPNSLLIAKSFQLYKIFLSPIPLLPSLRTKIF